MASFLSYLRLASCLIGLDEDLADCRILANRRECRFQDFPCTQDGDATQLDGRREREMTQITLSHCEGPFHLSSESFASILVSLRSVHYYVLCRGWEGEEKGEGREGEEEGEREEEGGWEEERLRGGRRAMARGVTLNGSNESVYSMIRQPSLFVKNTKSSRFVSLFLGEGMWEREGEGDGSRNGRRERGERERTYLMTVCMPFTCDFPADGKI